MYKINIIIKLILVISIFVTINFNCYAQKDKYNTVLYPFTPDDQTFGYLTKTGEIKLKPQFISASAFNDGVSVCKIKTKSCIVDAKGTLTVLDNIEIVSDFSEGLAVAKDNKWWGYINKDGKLVLKIFPITYKGFLGDPLYPFSNDLAPIVVKNRYGFIDKSGKIKIKPKFDATNGFFLGVAAVAVDNKWGVIDKKGNFIVNPTYKYISDASDYLIRIQLNNGWKYVDLTGNFIYSNEYDYSGNFKEGLASIKINEKWGFINKKGDIIIPPQFNFVSDFNQGSAIVQINEKWGFINKKGTFIILPIFNYIYTGFINELAYIHKNNEEGYINSDGVMIWKKTLK